LFSYAFIEIIGLELNTYSCKILKITTPTTLIQSATWPYPTP